MSNSQPDALNAALRAAFVGLEPQPLPNGPLWFELLQDLEGPTLMTIGEALDRNFRYNNEGIIPCHRFKLSNHERKRLELLQTVPAVPQQGDINGW